jgi:small subunit ribosomal protein S16
MLAIRLQRLGRKGHPVYRVAVQEAQRHPSSGRVVAYVGSFDPHTKAVKLNKEKIEFYLNNGAQPSPRVVRVLKAEKVKLPAWVEDVKGTNKRAVRNPEKLRKNRPAEPVADKPAEDAPTDEVVADKPAVPEAVEDKPAEAVKDEPAEEAPAEQPEAPAEASEAQPSTKPHESGSGAAKTNS